MLKHPPRCAGGVGLIPGGRTETSRVTEHVGPHGITGEPLHSRRRARVTQRRPHVPHLRADPDKRTVYLLKKGGMLGMWIRSLVGELRSHMLQGAAKT